MTYKTMIIIEQDNDGYYAFVPELEGCQSQGDTLDEVMNNMEEAVELYLETLAGHENSDISIGEHGDDDVTDALNQVYATENSSLDPVITQLQSTFLPGDEW